MPARSLRDGALTIKDAAASPATQTVRFVEGGLSWTEVNSVDVHVNRGSLDQVRKGSEEALTGQATFRYQDKTELDVLRDLTFTGGAGTAAIPQTVYAGWVNPETDAVVLAGATVFGRTLTAGDLIAGSSTSSGGVQETNPYNLLFEITDPSTGSVGESILFMGCHTTDFSLEEGDEFNEASFSFTTPVKRPHIF